MTVLTRWLVAFVLLTLTFDPTEWNYVTWARANFNTQMPLTVLFGLILLVGYIIYLRATLRSIGGIGMALVLAITGALRSRSSGSFTMARRPSASRGQSASGLSR